MHAKIKNYTGEKVIFGVRPEDFYDKKYISKADPDRTIKAKVDVIEPLSAETFIYLASGKHSLLGKWIHAHR